jgi:hypothetical protein
VKSKKRRDLLDDLKETFNNLYKYKMMLNPKKIHVLCIIRKTARLHGIVLVNRREPKIGGSHRTIATTLDLKRNPEAGRCDDSTQLIHIQVGQTWYAFLQATT